MITIVESKPMDKPAAISPGLGGWIKLQIETPTGVYQREFETPGDLFRECSHLFTRGQDTRYKNALVKYPGGIANHAALQRIP